MNVSHATLVNTFSMMLDAGTIGRARMDHFCKTFDCDEAEINAAINEVMVNRSTPDPTNLGDGK